ncbi:plastocyanin/azurin family copper-binding protein [Halomonas sp. LR3S48]|uniref:cupredoxin domain-containing protein n=1 Tax=Halomonadaceae TaxID=28256 RepID=UPI0021E4BA55|nr:plastocyanin/azurin family copper-binding protein [Halomonas sp. LR3S48]UYG03936.1 plastocyanin/azurin family copper-binding protein [Halomonas sp. LR3S48]
MRQRIGLTFGATALATLLLGGVVQAGDDVIEVEMRDYGFHPAELEVKVGTTVRWVNGEKRTSHDVFFADEEFGSERLFPEESWERTFGEPGSYPYHCRPHENRDMRGVIEVVGE